MCTLRFFQRTKLKLEWQHLENFIFIYCPDFLLKMQFMHLMTWIHLFHNKRFFISEFKFILIFLRGIKSKMSEWYKCQYIVMQKKYAGKNVYITRRPSWPCVSDNLTWHGKVSSGYTMSHTTTQQLKKIIIIKINNKIKQLK